MRGEERSLIHFLCCQNRNQGWNDSINLAERSITERIELHFLPIDVETDDLCSGPQTPSSQLERGCVSIYFRVSPCSLFKTLEFFVFRLLQGFL